MDARPLSERLIAKRRDPRHPMTYEEMSLAMGQPSNTVSRWVSRAVLPGPEKFSASAEFLGISEFEVGGAVGLDAVERSRAKHR